MNNLECLNYDYDLFFRCEGLTFHLATAGGYVSEEILASSQHVRIRSLLLNRNFPELDYKLNPALDEILSIKFESQKINPDTFDRESYLHDFIMYAKRGCFSFDRTFITDHFDEKYHLVAYPIFRENSFRVLRGMPIEDIVQNEFNRPQRIFY